MQGGYWPDGGVQQQIGYGDVVTRDSETQSGVYRAYTNQRKAAGVVVCRR